MSQNNRPDDECRDDDALCYEDPSAPADNVRAMHRALPAPALAGDRRHAPRMKYEAAGMLEPVATNAPGDVRVVTRDADPQGTGFVSSADVPEGSRAVLHLPAPDGEGRTQRIECRVRRSRELGNGLFEGSVEFLGAQPQFSDTRIRPAAFRAR
jgi:hypothetical protein